MKIIKVEEKQTSPMVVGYSIWPYNDSILENKHVNAIITGPYLTTYEEAEELATTILKDPNYIVRKGSEYLKITDEEQEEVIEILSGIEGFFINQNLCVFDEDDVCIDCPVEYVMDVGQVFKEEAPQTSEGTLLN